MKKSISIIFATCLFLLVSGMDAYSQFRGQIQFLVEDYTGRSSEAPSFSFTSDSQRLFISSEQKVDVIFGMKADGLLIRNDLEDFVLNTQNNQALKVTQKDLDALLNMIERYGGAADQAEADRFNWETGVEETGNTREHLGHELVEFRVKGDNEDQYASIWLTDDIKVEWGLMENLWERAGNRFTDAELPIELVMNPNSFPLLLEVFNRGRMIYKIESTSVNTNNYDRAVLELSDEKILIGLTDVMMNMFRQQR